MAKSPAAALPATPFSSYQKLVVALMALGQFTVVLDFMVMSPLGDLLIRTLKLTPSQFGLAVSAYAFSAGASGLLTAGFADRFDRKKLLSFFYAGFILGTVACGLAYNYETLIAARIVTGIFGGVIGSVSMAVVTDVFAPQQRGRAIGLVQMGFGVSQVLGIPVGLYLANGFGWEAPFWAIAGLSVLVWGAVQMGLKPLTGHLALQQKRSFFGHLGATLARPDYRLGFSTTALLSIGGFMMMPFGAAFAINNLGVSQAQLPVMFMVAGVATLIIMPVIGRLSDKVDRFVIFAAASVWLIVFARIYTTLDVTPFWQVLTLNVLMMMGVMARIVPATAISSAVPDAADRGAYMSINSSLQQIAGGIAAAIAGLIVVQPGLGQPLQHYDTVGWIVGVIVVITMLAMYRVNRMIKGKTPPPAAASATGQGVALEKELAQGVVD